MQIFYGTKALGVDELNTWIANGKNALASYGDLKGKVVVCRSDSQLGTVLQWKLAQSMEFIPMFTAPDFCLMHAYAHECYDIDIILDWKNGNWATERLDPFPHAQRLTLPPHSIIQMTSATTGEAKMVLRTQADIEGENKRYLQHMGFSAADRFMTIAPFYHSYAFFCVLRMCELTGADLILPDIILPRRLIELCNSMQVNCLYAIPYILEKMTEVTTIDAIGCEMKVVMSTAQAVSKTLDQKFAEKFGVHISSQYGNTEIGCVAMGSAEDCGRLKPLPGVQFSIVQNAANQNQLVIFTGETGGYYILRDGIQCLHETGFRTGDIAEVYTDGSIKLLGRADRVLIRAGEKLDAGYVEKILEGFPGIQKTTVHLNNRNELICSYATIDGQKADVSAWKDYCKGKLLSYQVPEHFVYVVALEKVGKSWKSLYQKNE